MSEAELAACLKRLERDNRRLKRIGLAALVVAAAVGTAAATRPVRVPDVIQAHEFQLLDSAGKVRASMNVAYGMTSVCLYGEHGFPSLVMSVNPDNSMTLGFLRSLDDTPVLIRVNAGGQPTIHLSDPQGYQMELGTTKTVIPATGEIHETSADSIMMFGNGKKHRVIWQAPY